MKFLFSIFLFLSAQAYAIHAVLLAGGGGTRLWPASRDEFPKQFIDFGTGKSLLQQTIERLQKLNNLQSIVISTNEQYRPLVEEQIALYRGQTPFTILVEPSRRNTAPAIAYAVKYLSEFVSPDDPILVVPADHFIEPDDAWAASIESALPAIANGQIATFGIRPSKPETGFGYLEFGPAFDAATQSVVQFIEKPNLEKAKQLIQSDRIFWNSGIFLFTPRIFLQELALHCPDLSQFCGSAEELLRNFHLLPNISIDFALMEKTRHMVAAPLDIHWSDIGSWDGLYEVLAHDENGNVLQGKTLGIETGNSLILAKEKLIALIGVEDLLVIETDDAILICKRHESQKIKELLKLLKP